MTAIVLTTVMMTTLFTIAGSIVRSMEESTMYQVGTSDHAGFKFLTEEEYERLSQDPEIHDLSYNIIVGDVLNDEVYEDYTEVRYTTEKKAAKTGFSMPETGRLPEEADEMATCTSVLDDFGIPHELGRTIHLRISNGFSEYEGDFRLCGYWEKPAATLAVSADIRYYGLLKTIGTTNRQLRRIIVRQAAMLSVIAIPTGMLLGYLISVVILPVITESFLNIPCSIHPDICIFIASAVFSWLVVWISCIKPCKVIRKVSPVEAVRYSEYTGGNLSGRKKTRKVSVISMAWENLKRSRRKTVFVVLSLALSIIMINVTVSIIKSFDKNLYIRQFAATDFMVTDGSILSKNYRNMDYEGVPEADIESISHFDGVTSGGGPFLIDGKLSRSVIGWKYKLGILQTRQDLH